MIRPRTPADLLAVQQLLSASSLPTAGIEAPGTEFLVAVAGERVVGCAGLERYGDVGLLRSVAVAPEWRGRGLGAGLTRRVLAVAEQRGIVRIYLLTETAAQYFRTFGFRAIPRSQADEAVQGSAEFTELCPASATLMLRAQGEEDAAVP
jgi:amino-acid N-acetyltransferase